jgi:hypothetical protein
MADADVAPDKIQKSNTDSSATRDVIASPSERWLDELLWSSTPPTEHLKKFQPRVKAIVPPSLIEGMARIDAVQVLGLPSNAEILGAEKIEPGTWRLAAENANTFLVIPSRDNEISAANLTIKIEGRETVDGDSISLLGGIQIELPVRHKGPLFADLPDMRQARERREAAAVAEQKAAVEKAEADKAAAEKAETDKAAAEKAEAEKVAADKAKAEKAATEKAAADLTAAEKAKAEKATAEKAEADKAAIIKAKAEKVPPKKPQRRAAVVLKPVDKPAPQPEPKSPAKPTRKAAVSWSKPPQPVKKPATTKPAEPVPATSAMPAAPAAPAVQSSVISVPETGTPESIITNMISLELGGAPEVGDPHFRVLVDGQQVLDGNIDWGLGLPASDDADSDICWQTREIPWDFSAGTSDVTGRLSNPDTIIVRYDKGAASEAAVGSLLIRSINVNGLRIDAEGPYASYPDDRAPWLGRSEHQSWCGDLVFNVAGALHGDPDFVTMVERDPSSDAAVDDDDTDKGQGPTPKEPRPLILRPAAADLSNRQVLAAFAALRRYIQAGIDEPDSNMQGMLDRLGFEKDDWSDLVVLAPDGNPVAIDDAPPPTIPDTEPDFDPSEVAQALADAGESPPIEETAPSVAAALSEDETVTPGITPIIIDDNRETLDSGRQIRDVFLAERLARASVLQTADHHRTLPEATSEESTETVAATAIPSSEGLRIRESFLTAWTIRAETYSLASSPEPEPQPKPIAAPIIDEAEVIAHLDRDAGQGIRQSFLTTQLKSALSLLHAGLSTAPETHSNATSPQRRTDGAAISSAFLENAIHHI